MFKQAQYPSSQHLSEITRLERTCCLLQQQLLAEINAQEVKPAWLKLDVILRIGFLLLEETKVYLLLAGRIRIDAEASHYIGLLNLLRTLSIDQLVTNPNYTNFLSIVNYFGVDALYNAFIVNASAYQQEQIELQQQQQAYYPPIFMPPQQQFMPGYYHYAPPPTMLTQFNTPQAQFMPMHGALASIDTQAVIVPGSSTQSEPISTTVLLPDNTANVMPASNRDDIVVTNALNLSNEPTNDASVDSSNKISSGVVADMQHIVAEEVIVASKPIPSKAAAKPPIVKTDEELLVEKLRECIKNAQIIAFEQLIRDNPTHHHTAVELLLQTFSRKKITENTLLMARNVTLSIFVDPHSILKGQVLNPNIKSILQSRFAKAQNAEKKVQVIAADANQAIATKVPEITVDAPIGTAVIASPAPAKAIKQKKDKAPLPTKALALNYIEAEQIQEYNALLESIDPKVVKDAVKALFERIENKHYPSYSFICYVRISFTKAVELLDKLAKDECLQGLLYNICSRVIATDNMEEYFSNSQAISVNIAAIKNKKEREKIFAAFTRQQVALNEWRTQKYAEEFAYLERLNHGDDAALVKLKYSLGAPNAINQDGESLLMVAVRQKLGARTIKAICEATPAELLLMKASRTEGKPSNQNVLHYFSRYLSKGCMASMFVLFERFISACRDTNKCVMNTLNGIENRDLEGNTFFHVLIAANDDEKIIEVLQKLVEFSVGNANQAITVNMLVSSGLPPNNAGYSAYSLLYKKAITKEPLVHPDDRVRSLLLGLLSTAAIDLSLKMQPDKLELYFPDGKCFFHAPNDEPLFAFAKAADLGAMIHIVSERSALRAKIWAAYQMNIMSKQESAVLDARFTPIINYMQSLDLYLLYGDVPLYSLIINTILLLLYPNIFDPNKAPAEKATLTTETEHRENLQEIAEFCLLKKPFADVASLPGTIITPDQTLAWRVFKLYADAGMLDELPPVYVAALTIQCVVEPLPDVTVISDVAIVLNRLDMYEFLHKNCSASIGIRELLLAAQAYEQDPNKDLKIMHYMLDNFVNIQPENYNIIQYIIAMTVERFEHAAEINAMLRLILQDPVRSQKMLEHKNCRQCTPLDMALASGILIVKTELDNCKGTISASSKKWYQQLGGLNFLPHACEQIRILISAGASLETELILKTKNILFKVLLIRDPGLMQFLLDEIPQEKLRSMFAETMNGKTLLQLATEYLQPELYGDNQVLRTGSILTHRALTLAAEKLQQRNTTHHKPG